MNYLIWVERYLFFVFLNKGRCGGIEVIDKLGGIIIGNFCGWIRGLIGIFGRFFLFVDVFLEVIGIKRFFDLGWFGERILIGFFNFLE